MVLLSIDFASLHTILESLYNEMMPLCEDMLGVAKGVAGLGALFYVAVRVWQSMARAEPVDVYPLLRPFALGICILLFPTLVLGTMNSILSPIVQGTHRMLEGQTLDMQQYRAQKDRLEREAMMRNPETAYLVSDEEFDRQLVLAGPSSHLTLEGLHMDFMRLTHEGAQYREVPHYGCILEYDGFRVLIAGDCAVADPQLRDFIGNRPIDLALLNFPWVTLRKGRHFIEQAIRPEHLVVYHLPFSHDDRWGYRDAAVKGAGQLQGVPDVRLLLEPFQREILT